MTETATHTDWRWRALTAYRDQQAAYEAGVAARRLESETRVKDELLHALAQLGIPGDVQSITITSGQSGLSAEILIAGHRFSKHAGIPHARLASTCQRCGQPVLSAGLATLAQLGRALCETAPPHPQCLAAGATHAR